MKKGFSNLFVYMDIPDDKKDVILDLVNILTIEDQVILKKKCGSNLDGIDTSTLTKEETQRLYSTIMSRLKNGFITLSSLNRGSKEYNEELNKLKVAFARTRKSTSISNLIAYFNNLYSFAELDAVIKSLNKNEADGIYAVCGVLLDGNNTKEDSLTKEERTKVNTHYLPKVKTRLRKLYPNRGVEPVSEDKLDIPSNEPVVEEKLALESLFSGIVVKDDIGFTKEDYLDIVKIFNSEEFKELTKLNMPLEEVIVASLLHHGFRGKRFNIEDLVKFLGIDRASIVAIAKKSTETYRKAINDSISEYEDKLLKLITTGNKGE